VQKADREKKEVVKAAAAAKAQEKAKEKAQKRYDDLFATVCDTPP
jgi:hypothetical protein